MNTIYNVQTRVTSDASVESESEIFVKQWKCAERYVHGKCTGQEQQMLDSGPGRKYQDKYAQYVEQKLCRTIKEYSYAEYWYVELYQYVEYKLC